MSAVALAPEQAPAKPKPRGYRFRDDAVDGLAIRLGTEIRVLRALNDVLVDELANAVRMRDFWRTRFLDAVHVIGNPRR